MRADLSDVTLIVDRSGSMQFIRQDAEGGIKAFLEAQRAVSGELLVTLVQFDSEYEFVCQGVPLSQVPPYSLEPRGSTALLDAVGRSIDEAGVRLAAMPEAERPGLVTIVIVTDGQENSSRQYSAEKVRQMIEHQQSVYKWKFVFLSSDLNAVSEAREMGIADGAVLHFGADKTLGAWNLVAKKLGELRFAAADEDVIDIQFSPEERQQMQ